VRAVPLSGLQRRYDIGSFAGYFRAFLEFALMDERLGSELRTYLEDANRRLQTTDGTD
jgi:UTP-glucose-1-phosphate uridylyltransferase